MHSRLTRARQINTSAVSLTGCARYTTSQTLSVPTFLPRCMECRRGLAMTILSFCLSVCLSVKRVHCDKRRFPSKIALRLKKVCYKVSLRENCQRKSYQALIGITICAKMFCGGDPFYLKFWVKLTALERNRRFSI